jgi:hypothetical protein
MQESNVEKKYIMDRRKGLVRQLCKEGFSCGQIAQMINLERTYIWRIIKQDVPRKIKLQTTVAGEYLPANKLVVIKKGKAYLAK